MYRLDEIPKGIFDSVSLPKTPILTEKEFSFPSDPTSVSSEELSGVLLKVTSWRSYAVRQLALVNAKKESVKMSYEKKIRIYMADLDTKGKTKDKVIAEAHRNDTKLDELEDKMRTFSVEENTWQKIINIYEIQVEAVSKELSRRSAELRSLGRP